MIVKISKIEFKADENVIKQSNYKKEEQVLKIYFQEKSPIQDFLSYIKDPEVDV